MKKSNSLFLFIFLFQITLFGHIDGWQWKPNLLWVDNLRTMPTPNYQVQKLFSTNKGTHILPILYKNKEVAAGQDSLYASAVFDKNTNEIIIKIVNASAKTQQADIQLEGLKTAYIQAAYTLLQGNPDAINTF